MLYTMLLRDTVEGYSNALVELMLSYNEQTRVEAEQVFAGTLRFSQTRSYYLNSEVCVVQKEHWAWSIGDKIN